MLSFLDIPEHLLLPLLGSLNQLELLRRVIIVIRCSESPEGGGLLAWDGLGEKVGLRSLRFRGFLESTQVYSF